MLGPERNRLETWVASLNQADQDKIAQEQERSSRKKALWESWKKSAKEERQYLSQSGALTIFRDAGKILKKRWPDTKIEVSGGPEKRSWIGENSERSYPLGVNLLWDYKYKDDGYDNRYWLAKAVWCSVARDEETGEIKGLSFSDKSLATNSEEIKQALASSILEAKHGLNRMGEVGAPSIIKNVVAHVAGHYSAPVRI